MSTKACYCAYCKGRQRPLVGFKRKSNGTLTKSCFRKLNGNKIMNDEYKLSGKRRDYKAVHNPVNNPEPPNQPPNQPPKQPPKQRKNKRKRAKVFFSYLINFLINSNDIRDSDNVDFSINRRNMRRLWRPRRAEQTDHSARPKQATALLNYL
jgi:hypothetical protein